MRQWTESSPRLDALMGFLATFLAVHPTVEAVMKDDYFSAAAFGVALFGFLAYAILRMIEAMSS